MGFPWGNRYWEYVLKIYYYWIERHVGEIQIILSSNNYDFSKLPSKRFHYICSQTIITSLNNKEEYRDTIEKGRTKTAYSLKFDIERLVKYYKLNDYEDNDVSTD